MKDGILEWFSYEVATAVNAKVNILTKQCAERVAQDARSLCPVGTITRAASGADWSARTPGTLRDSIRPLKSRYKDGGWIVMAGNYKAYYARMVELGVPNAPAHPFLRPALHKNEGYIRRTLGVTAA